MDKLRLEMKVLEKTDRKLDLEMQVLELQKNRELKAATAAAGGK